MKEDNRSFNYSYSASDRDEVKRIRDKYTSPEREETDKMELLRRLDESVTRKASAIALILGILGTLIMGTGMSLIMTDMGPSVGLSTSVTLILGLAFGIVGLVIVALAYPVYNGVCIRERKRITPEIIRLTDELLK